MIKIKKGHLYHYTDCENEFEGEIQVGGYYLQITGEWLEEKGGRIYLTFANRKGDYIGDGILFENYPSRLGMITVRLYKNYIDIYLRLDLIKRISSKKYVKTFYTLTAIQN